MKFERMLFRRDGARTPKARISAIAVLGPVAFAMLACAGCLDTGAAVPTPAARMSATCGSPGDPGYVECDEGRTMAWENAKLHGQSCALDLEGDLARNG